MTGSRLQKYKAELRAKGEKLTWAELGYPRPPQTNSSLEQLTNAVAKIDNQTIEPGTLQIMNFVGPGRARVCWAETAARVSGYGRKSADSMSWDAYRTELRDAGEALQEIRQALQYPPSYSNSDPDGLSATPISPLVQKRTAAQWLMGDTIAGLQSGELARARQDLHALVQLVQLHKDEMNMVNQMIRVAIAGLALAATWEALAADGWSEQDLTTMQKDWEGASLIDSLEFSLLSQRAFAESTFAHIRSGSNNLDRIWWRRQTGDTPIEYFEGILSSFLWSADEDELQSLENLQQTLELVRKLKQSDSWPRIHAELKTLTNAIHTTSVGLNRYRHPLSSLIMPNIVRAGQTTVCKETLRRLTVTVIALKRFRLSQAKFPSDLNELVPDCLTAVPIDPMSGKPLRYRLNGDGNFTLWSVGEDGKDNNGDPNSPSPPKELDLWSGRDAVWPLPEWGTKVQNLDKASAVPE